MKIKRLELKNFRGYAHFEATFKEDINVLVGPNGFGKTTVLDAIACALGPFISGFETGKDVAIQEKDIRLNKHRIIAQGNSAEDSSETIFNMERQFPVVIGVECFPSNDVHFPQKWQRTRSTLKGRGTQVPKIKQLAEQLQASVQNNGAVILPLISYYGTGRLWKQRKITEANSPSNMASSRLDGYKDCLDPESSYVTFSAWLRKETIADLENTLRIIKLSGLENAVVNGRTLRGQLLGAVSTAINQVIAPSGWCDIHFSSEAGEVVATHPVQGVVPVSMLSDGVRNMIGMVADIAHRAVRLNPQLGENAVKLAQGVVLIDEVDMHLHPQWQQLVLQNLVAAFPGLQFFVTTHSPQVLTTVQSEKILLLPDVAAGETRVSHPLGETLGKESGYVLTQTLKVDTRPPLPQVQLFEEYLRLIGSGLAATTEAQAARARLEDLVGPEHEDLQKADRLIKRRELLG